MLNGVFSWRGAKENRVNTTESYMKSAEIFNPRNVEHLAHCALILRNLGRSAEAAAYLRKASANGHDAYARFIYESAFAGAESYVRRADYAILLSEQGRDAEAEFYFSSAAAYYEPASRTHELLLRQSYNLLNFSDFLFSRRRPAEAFAQLRRIRHYGKLPPEGQALFLIARLMDNTSDRLESLAAMKSLILKMDTTEARHAIFQEGEQDRFLPYAREHGHPDLELLEELALVLCGRQSAESLDRFEDWHTMPAALQGEPT